MTRAWPQVPQDFTQAAIWLKKGATRVIPIYCRSELRFRLGEGFEEVFAPRDPLQSK